jgi:hypothetical protein
MRFARLRAAWWVLRNADKAVVHYARVEDGGFIVRPPSYYNRVHVEGARVAYRIVPEPREP